MKELKKYLKTKGLWTFWVFVVFAAVVIYFVANQVGLALVQVNTVDDQTTFSLSVKTPAKSVAR